MEAFFVSLGVVALAELGDKTQLLVLLLAARYRRPLAIAGGVAAATVASHLLAALAGVWVAEFVSPAVLAWAVGLAFIAMGLWALAPDSAEAEHDKASPPSGRSAFLATAIAFFIAELGDKTQVAVVGLAVRFDMVVTVVAGTTLAMLAANLPALVFGHAFASRLPIRAIRIAGAAVFVGLGVWTIVAGAALFAGMGSDHAGSR
ncbi:MAG: TMEM165/GDT1 family protein [Sphingomonadales bacterium]